MSFLRRLLGSDAKRGPEREPEPEPGAAPHDEATYERDLLTEESRRLNDDFIQRQMRFADKSWTPPSQGGTRRADDTEDAE